MKPQDNYPDYILFPSTDEDFHTLDFRALDKNRKKNRK